MAEWDRDVARDAGRDFYGGQHLPREGGRAAVSRSEAIAAMIRDRSPLPRHTATEGLCPSCGMPELREVTNIGPRGYVYVSDRCTECGWASEPTPDI